MATVTQRGNSWRARIRLKGQTLTRTFDTEAQAKRWVEVEEARIVRGETAAQVRKAPSPVTVADMFDRYAREVSPEKRGGQWEALRLRKIAPSFPMAAIAVDGATMAEWRNSRLGKVSASTVNRELNLISAVFTRAIKEWRLPLAVNPVQQIQWPRKPHARKRRVSDDERAEILKQLGWAGDAAPVGRREWIAWGFCLALETMMRLGEILHLTWQHIHLDRKFCHLPETKNGYPRDVPLSSRAVALFRLLQEGLPGQRVVPVEAGTFGAYFREAVKAAGIEDLHFHDTRREALTRLAPKFGNPMDLGAASGHRDYRSLRVYYEPDVTALADKLG